MLTNSAFIVDWLSLYRREVFNSSCRLLGSSWMVEEELASVLYLCVRLVLEERLLDLPLTEVGMCIPWSDESLPTLPASFVRELAVVWVELDEWQLEMEAIEATCSKSFDKGNLWKIPHSKE